MKDYRTYEYNKPETFDDGCNVETIFSKEEFKHFMEFKNSDVGKDLITLGYDVFEIWKYFGRRNVSINNVYVKYPILIDFWK